MNRARAGMLMVIVVGAVSAAGQPVGESEPAPGLGDSIPRLDARLSALHPSRPHEYFELGEEVDAEGGIRLATELYALTLSMALDTGDAPLGAGACVALAGLAETDRERRWLAAVARTIDERFSLPALSAAVTPRVDEAAARGADVFTFVRAGDGYEARRLLAEPGVRDAIARVVGDEWLGRLGEQADAWPCAECRNRRFIPDRDARAGERLCPVCGANPGEPLDRAGLIAHLSAEAALLGVEPESWAALLLGGAGEPMHDPDPGEVPARVGVDPGARYWRGGRWSREGGP